MSTDVESQSSNDRFILTRVGEQTLVFAATLVLEIVMVERFALLPLPFYDPMVLGVIHHQGSVVPLVSLRRVLGAPEVLLLENLTAVRLSSLSPELTGAGLVVDQVLGSAAPDQLSLPPDPETPGSSAAIRFFQAQDLPARIWRPQRWQPGGYVV